MARGETPDLLTRAVVGLVRTVFPSSDPTRVYYLADGAIFAELSGGPTSGALGGQAAVLLGGINLQNLGEEFLDSLIQEATGLRIGPSIAKGIKSPRGPKASPGGGTRGADVDSKAAPEIDSPRAGAGRDATDGGTPAAPVRQYWTRTIEFEEVKIYQRDDLIDPHLVDPSGRTNVQRMQSGRAPVDSDGRPLNLHHMIQAPDGPLAEVTEMFHRRRSKSIHINPNTMRSGISRSHFDTFREDYWKHRARDFQENQYELE
jgi:hypothetical protein